MELVQPGIGLIFWMTLSFSLVLLILGKFAWPAITKGLKEREQSIDDALRAADKAREEMQLLKVDNEELLKQAKGERDEIMNEARKLRDKIVEEAKGKATVEADKIVESARERIENDKMSAMTDLKNQIAILSIEIAEKILKEELSGGKKQEELIKKLTDDVKLN
jgi:F-type H+-transporting ATPase subunit b